MNHRTPRFALAAVALAAALGSACATNVDVAATGGSGAGGSSNASSGAGGAGNSGGGAPIPCVVQPADPDAGFKEATCADLAVLTVRDPWVEDDGMDGHVSPGESATLHIVLQEIGGVGFSWYPGVSFSSELATIVDPGSAQLYAIFACQSVDLAVKITVPASVPSGTVVEVKAQVSMLGPTCPDAFSITIPITVQ